MKRNIGFLIIAISQMLNYLGFDVKINSTEVDTISTAVGSVILAIGVVHDLVRRFKR